MTTGMNEIMIDLQGGAKAPLYQKIYDHLKKEITCGAISKGTRIPSTRLLAKQLMVSRSTVEMAYEQLLAEGYIKSEACRGFFVCDITELYQLEGKQNKSEGLNADFTSEPVWGKETAKKLPDCYADFSPDAIDTEHFPYNVWRKLNKDVWLDDREELLLSGEGQGDERLGNVIAQYLYQARGVNCHASQIILGAGNEYLEILLAQVLGTKKKILMEDPTYLQAYHTFCNLGFQVETILGSDKGIEIESVHEIQPDAIYIMPSHQFPLGTVMPQKARLELLNWANEKEGRYLIEDDHDSEFRYRGKPIPSLQSFDRNGKVIYLGTFSKSIAPSLRVSYMVLPLELLREYRRKCGFYSTTVPKMQQEVLRKFIEEGHFGRHLNRMRAIYKAKHDFITAELKKYKWVKRVSGDHAGLHVLIEVDTNLTEQELCEQARKAGIKINGISEYYIHKQEERCNPVILLGYGKLDNEKIKEGLKLLNEVVETAD